jgi:hypothetical protein
MFVKGKIVTAEGVDNAEVEAPSQSRPTYRCRCLDCPTAAEGIAELGVAEHEAKCHAKLFRHRVRLAMDLVDIEIEIINGEEQEG